MLPEPVIFKLGVTPKCLVPDEMDVAFITRAQGGRKPLSVQLDIPGHFKYNARQMATTFRKLFEAMEGLIEDETLNEEDN